MDTPNATPANGTAEPQSMLDRIMSGLDEAGIPDDASFDATKATSTMTLDAPVSPEPRVDANGRTHGEDGKFVPSDPASPDAAAAPVVETATETAQAATVALGDLGEIPLAEVPTLFKEMVEYERAKLTPQLEALQSQQSTLQQQIQALQKQAQEATEYANTVIHWARSNPENFFQAISDPNLGAYPQQAQPAQSPWQPRQAPQQQAAYLTQEQAEALWAKKQAEQQATFESQQREQARAQEIQKSFDTAMTNVFPTTEFPDEAVRTEIFNAVAARIAAAPKGTFSKDMPIAIATRKVVSIAQTVKQNIQKMYAQKVAAQAAVNAKSAPTPKGGGTMVPKKEPLGPEQYRGTALVNRLQRRLDALQG